jgi:hypothetical protein
MCTGPGGVRLLDASKQAMHIRPEFLVGARAKGSGKEGAGAAGESIDSALADAARPQVFKLN